MGALIRGAALGFLTGKTAQIPSWSFGCSFGYGIIDAITNSTPLTTGNGLANRVALAGVRHGRTSLVHYLAYKVGIYHAPLNLLYLFAKRVSNLSIPYISSAAANVVSGKALGSLDGLKARDIALAAFAALMFRELFYISTEWALGSERAGQLQSTQIDYGTLQSSIALTSSNGSDTSELDSGACPDAIFIRNNIVLSEAFMNLVLPKFINNVFFVNARNTLDAYITQPLAYAVNRSELLSSLRGHKRFIATSILCHSVTSGIFAYLAKKLFPKMIEASAAKVFAMSLAPFLIQLGIKYLEFGMLISNEEIELLMDGRSVD